MESRHLQLILRAFDLEGQIDACIPVNRGHINDSYHLINKNPELTGYFLQRINHFVFARVDHLMHNIATVLLHQKKHADIHAGHLTLTLIPTMSGAWFLKLENSYWRLFEFISETRVFDTLPCKEAVYETARGFALFTKELSGLNPTHLHVLLPEFHSLSFRMKQLKHAIENDKSHRKKQAKELITLAMRDADDHLRLESLQKKGIIPLRTTHNDTKCNNVLFDSRNHKAICVIDLDTVMPGIVHYDFGDGVRTSAVCNAEDESDLSAIGLDKGKFQAYCKGYLEALGETLTPIEVESLHLSPPYMAFIMGIRFLTDFLNGDVYYKIAFPDHNLQRAKCQLTLSKIMRSQEVESYQLMQSFFKKGTYSF